MPTGHSANITKEFLEEEYVKLCKSSRTIALSLGCDKTTVLRALKTFDIPLKKGTGNHTKDLTDKKFFSLTVKGISHKTPKGEVFWKCLCDCGKEVNVIGNSLKRNHTKSCGCRRKYSANRNRFVGKISGSMWYHIQSCSSQKGRVFEITQEYAWGLYLRQNCRCALSGEILSLPETSEQYEANNWTASLDRIDSAKGYIEGNVQWVTKKINQIKMDMKQDIFINTCQNVVDYQYSQKYQG